MIDPDLLRLAVQRGIFSPAQAEAMAALAAEREPTTAAPASALPTHSESEALRFVSGFGDIFVTLGIGLVLASAGYFAGDWLGATAKWAVLAALSWALAEFFTRRRRMALPSIALLLAFVGTAFVALAHAFGAAAGGWQPGRGWFVNWLGVDLSHPGQVASAALVTAALAAIHFARFRVPITIAAGTGALAGAVLALLYAAVPGLVDAWRNPLLLACGLVVFALAMRFDLSDPARLTRRTDIAFWLHLLAAPLIVHPAIAPLVHGDQARDVGAATLVLAVFLAFGFVAVTIDRRALLVSGLTYAGVAVATIVARSGIAFDRVLPATLLGLGTFVLVLSAGWQPLRRGLLQLLPAPLARRLPSPTLISS